MSQPRHDDRLDDEPSRPDDRHWSNRRVALITGAATLAAAALTAIANVVVALLESR